MICGIVVGTGLGLFVAYYLVAKKNKQTLYMRQQVDKFTDFYQLMNHWVEIKNNGKSVAEYFKEQGYYNIAVYGMADMANRLYEDLERTDVTILYGIDREVCCTSARVGDVYTLEDNLPMIDAIVVTPFYAFDSIKRDLEKRVSCPIISIEEVLWSV